jgi:hypothetical protein
VLADGAVQVVVSDKIGAGTPVHLNDDIPGGREISASFSRFFFFISWFPFVIR